MRGAKCRHDNLGRIRGPAHKRLVQASCAFHSSSVCPCGGAEKGRDIVNGAYKNNDEQAFPLAFACLILPLPDSGSTASNRGPRVFSI